MGPRAREPGPEAPLEPRAQGPSILQTPGPPPFVHPLRLVVRPRHRHRGPHARLQRRMGLSGPHAISPPRPNSPNLRHPRRALRREWKTPPRRQNLHLHARARLPPGPELIQHRPRRPLQIEARGNGAHLAQNVPIQIQTRLRELQHNRKRLLPNQTHADGVAGSEGNGAARDKPYDGHVQHIAERLFSE